MPEVKITKWIDIKSDEAKKIDMYPYVVKVVESGLKHGIIVPDKLGNLYLEDGVTPVHAMVDGEWVGIRKTINAAN